jgi:hypothetical protein
MPRISGWCVPWLPLVQLSKPHVRPSSQSPSLAEVQKQITVSRCLWQAGCGQGLATVRVEPQSVRGTCKRSVWLHLCLSRWTPGGRCAPQTSASIATTAPRLRAWLDRNRTFCIRRLAWTKAGKILTEKSLLDLTSAQSCRRSFITLVPLRVTHVAPLKGYNVNRRAARGSLRFRNLCETCRPCPTERNRRVEPRAKDPPDGSRHSLGWAALSRNDAELSFRC